MDYKGWLTINSWQKLLFELVLMLRSTEVTVLDNFSQLCSLCVCVGVCVCVFVCLCLEIVSKEENAGLAHA